MRHLKSFRNWLTNVWHAWALPQQLGISDSYRDEQVAEKTQAHQAAADVTLAESMSTVAAQPSQRPEPVRSSITSGPSQAVEAMPVEPAASTPIPEKIVQEATIRDGVWVASGAELKKAITLAKEVATVSRKPVADERSAVSQPEAQALQTVATDGKLQAEEAMVKDEARPVPIDEPKTAVTPTSELATVPQTVAVEKPSAIRQSETQTLQRSPAQVNPHAEAMVTDDGRVAPIAEPKKAVTPPREVPRVPRQAIADQPSAVSQSEAQVRPRVSARLKPQGVGTIVTDEPSMVPIAEPKKPVTPVREVATVPRKTVADPPSAVPKPEPPLPQRVSTPVKPQGAEAVVTDARRAAPIAEQKKTATRSKKVAPMLQPAPAAQPSAPKTQIPQTVSANLKPHGANGSSSAAMSRRGKYDPGTINDQTAQRLARLLVSEIKLYNMNKIEAAGQVNNIYDLLKDPIDKSRQHYRQRLGKAAIETMPDYFHVELVRSLCAGDPSRLGPNYQAPDEIN